MFSILRVICTIISELNERLVIETKSRQIQKTKTNKKTNNFNNLHEENTLHINSQKYKRWEKPTEMSFFLLSLHIFILFHLFSTFELIFCGPFFIHTIFSIFDFFIHLLFLFISIFLPFWSLFLLFLCFSSVSPCTRKSRFIVYSQEFLWAALSFNFSLSRRKFLDERRFLNVFFFNPETLMKKDLQMCCFKFIDFLILRSFPLLSNFILSISNCLYYF